jgi:transcriptional/translational regulatory protein YebC/TACO1
MIECATNNRNRTFPEVRHAFTKCGGSVAEPGSVAFQFAKKGVIRIKGSGDDALLQALDAGAEDAAAAGHETLVYTDPKELMRVRSALMDSGAEVMEAALCYEPNSTFEVSDAETARKVMRLIDTLDELDDTVQVYTNFELADGIDVE